MCWDILEIYLDILENICPAKKIAWNLGNKSMG